MNVTKRDGKIVVFDERKIRNAIQGANSRTNEMTSEDIEKVTNVVINKIIRLGLTRISVEQIQDLVEDSLMKSRFNKTAKSYILYRDKRTRARGSITDKTFTEFLSGKSEYWNNENSNKDATVVTTQRDYLAGIASTDLARRFLLPPDVCEAHDAGIIHQHDMDYMAQKALNNCFSGDTEFITHEGVKRFDSFYDGERVEVLDKDGIWRDATVHKYGKQKMYDVTFKTPRNIKTVTCTANHRWILKDGTVTTELKIGDVLLPTKPNNEYMPKTLNDIKWFCFGLVLGNGHDCGTIDAQLGHNIRLCGSKIKYSNYFKQLKYKESKIENDLNYYHKRGLNKQEFLEKEGWKYLTKDEKIALFNGLYAADGCHDGRLAIHTANRQISKLITETADIAGYYHLSVKEEIRDTNYKKDTLLITHRFMKSQSINWAWKVIDISPHFSYDYEDREGQDLNHEIVAWCVDEPITHSFTLANGMITGNCCLINLEDMLQNGTVVNGIKIDPPHKLLTATTIATQIITAVASSQYGGTTITLTHLAPFVRKSYNKYLEDVAAELKDVEVKDKEELIKKIAEKRLHKEIEAAVQTFNYQVNSMSTTNGQAPFLSVNMWVNEDPEYKKEIAMLIEEFLNQRILGMKNEKGVYITPAFPKLLYVLDEDNVEEGSEYYYLTKLAAKCTAKRMVPDYISAKKMREYKISKAYGTHDVYPCMGCRSFLTPDRTTENYAKALNYKPGVSKYYGRFNMGVTTINLADVALSSNGNYDKFWKLLEERCELCHKGLKARIDRLEEVTSDVAPILWQYGALARLEKGEKLHDLIHHGYSTASLGYAGLYECVKYMTGHSHTDGAEGEKFGLEVMQKLNDYCNKWKAEEDIDYSVYGTPIESGTYKFAKALKSRFGNDVFIKLDGKDRNYITNSYHVPVFEHINAFDKLAIESKFQKLSPGGAISYVETANLTGNPEAVLEVIKFIYNNIMYAELNTKSDYCQVCGYSGEMQIDDNMQWYCPSCGNRDQHKMNVARRTCGYIGTKYWNYGRTQEIKERYVHLGGEED